MEGLRWKVDVFQLTTFPLFNSYFCLPHIHSHVCLPSPSLVSQEIIVLVENAKNETLLCPLCGGVFRDPYIATCGVRLSVPAHMVAAAVLVVGMLFLVHSDCDNTNYLLFWNPFANWLTSLSFCHSTHFVDPATLVEQNSVLSTTVLSPW